MGTRGVIQGAASTIIHGMADPERARTERSHQAGIAMFALFALGFCFVIAAVWPLLVSRLNLANWLELVLGHSALLLSMINLYVKARKQNLVSTSEVLFLAGLALMVSGMDLSLLLKH